MTKKPPHLPERILTPNRSLSSLLADLGLNNYKQCVLYLPDFGCLCVRTEAFLQFLHKWSRVFKETLVSGTQIVQTGFSVLCFGETVSWALAMACKLPLALLALCRQATGFHVGKGHLPFAVHHIQDATVADIAKIVFREHEMVATIYVPVVFHHGGMPAPVGQGADAGSNPCPVGQGGLEGLDEDLSHVIPVPFVEDGTEKFAPCLGQFSRRIC